MSFWDRLAARPVATVLLACVTFLAVTLLVTSGAGVPEPEVHDEGAQLTMSDIFSHGRLKMPPHPFWQHFETFHVIVHPVYQGKYPPGPALFMALGQTATEHPIVGVWLSMLALIAGTGYAMYGWLPPRWAAVGVALLCVRFGVVGDYVQSYYGGATAAAGGALVLGAAARLLNNPSSAHGAALGAGLVLLAMSRPFEGAFYSLPTFALLLHRGTGAWPYRRQVWIRFVPAAGLAVSLGGGWLAYYNWSITGRAFTPAYALYEETYSGTPLFIWQRARPTPALRHHVMVRFEEGQSDQPRRWPSLKLSELSEVVWNYLKPTLALALAAGLLAYRRNRPAVGIAAASVAAVFVATSLSYWSGNRYMAPMVPALYLLITLGLVEMSRRQLLWRAAAALVVAGLVGAVAVTAVRYVVTRSSSDAWWAAKRDIRQHLLELPGDDLVFVRYSPDHEVAWEWVYNGAVIDEQPVVWAREIDPAADLALRSYFRDRRAWVVLADGSPPRLLPWPGHP